MNIAKQWTMGFGLLMAMTLLLLPLQGIQAQDSKEAIAERMKERTVQLNVLKDQKVVGENWDGTLTQLKPIASEENTALIENENKDRKALFAILASDLDTSVDRIAERFRKRRYLLAKPDHMIQNPEKEWILKKNATQE